MKSMPRPTFSVNRQSKFGDIRFIMTKAIKMCMNQKCYTTKRDRAVAHRRKDIKIAIHEK